MISKGSGDYLKQIASPLSGQHNPGQALILGLFRQYKLELTGNKQKPKSCMNLEVKGGKVGMGNVWREGENVIKCIVWNYQRINKNMILKNSKTHIYIYII